MFFDRCELFFPCKKLLPFMPPWGTIGTTSFELRFGGSSVNKIKNRTLWFLWAALYIVTAGLGFIPANSGFVMALLMLPGIGFFVPPAILLYRGITDGDPKLVGRIRGLSLASLCATVVLLALNVASVLMSEAMGIFLNILLGLVSAPMMCVQFRGIGMFLWACLLMSTLFLRKKP